ncbi:Conserved_hypothetical protein [Hexamita inflata]|uniref:Uncharacterized protein n=1 Tax=Hexamita inflata TaxID=28002 RepID=A0AA86QES6_9EUKA|nr:Conserved hypothetical protein [Hexamita inflata]
MRDLIKKAMSNEEPLDKQFQQFVKQALSKDYHRSSFSIAFNNTKRQVMKELGKTELPAARPVIRLDSNKDVRQLLEQQQHKLLQNQNNKTQIRQQIEEKQREMLKEIRPTHQQLIAKPQPLIIQQQNITNIPVIPEAPTPQILEKIKPETPRFFTEEPADDLFMSYLTSEESDFADMTFDHCESPYLSIYTRNVIPPEAYCLEESCMSIVDYTNEISESRGHESRTTVSETTQIRSIMMADVVTQQK